MYILLILCSLIVFTNCGKKDTNKAYLPKMEFKRTPNPNYDNYFPSEPPSKLKNDKNEVPTLKEPVPSFPEKTTTNTKQQDSPGFFSFFKKNDDKKNEQENICEELLDINKNILIDQNTKIVVLNKDNLALKKQIDDLQNQINILDQEKLNSNELLEKEVDRLNKLIKLLSTELK